MAESEFIVEIGIFTFNFDDNHFAFLNFILSSTVSRTYDLLINVFSLGRLYADFGVLTK